MSGIILVIGGVLIGAIIGLAIAGWRHAATIAPPLEQQFHFTSVGLQRADPEYVDALWQQQLFRQMAKSRLFEIEY